MKLPEKKPTVADFALVFIVILSGILFLIFSSLGSPSSRATVAGTDGVFTVDLSNDAVYSVSSNGIDYVIEVSDCEIDVIKSNCPDGTCLNTKSIGKRPGSIVCVPGKLVISCGDGGENENGADFIIP